MPNYDDLEKYVCQVSLKRPDIAGPPVYAPIPFDGTVAVLPWFRPAAQRAHAEIQKPYYILGADGKQELLFGGNWRGMEVTADLPYGVNNFDGIAYPDGYRTMRYVYLINPITGRAHHRPLKSVSETEKNTQFGESNGWGWCGYWDWGWDDWCGNCDGGQVRWMDRNDKFYLTHTPKVTPLTLRMVYDGLIQSPTDVSYTNKLEDWFTIHLFQGFASLCEAICWKNMGEDENSARARKDAERSLGNSWKLNQAQKAGSNNRVYVPVRSSQRGW